jgi:hypothetical protein
MNWETILNPYVRHTSATIKKKLVKLSLDAYYELQEHKIH